MMIVNDAEDRCADGANRSKRLRACGRLLALGLVVASLPACMLVPTDDQAVCGRDAAVTFAGFTLGPNQTVSLAVATTSTGPFTVFATATSSTRVTTVSGTALYGWTTDAVVPSWAYHAPGYQAFVKATLPNYPNGLVTFDTVNASGQSAVQCISAQVSMGKNAVEAGVACQGIHSPVVRLSAPAVSSCPCPTSFTGDIVIDGVSSAVTSRCLTTLNGSLTVTASAPASVSLAALAAVGGNVTLDYTTPAGTARTIDLSVLPNIGGNLMIQGTISSGDLALGLDQVASVHGNVNIQLENAKPTGALAFVSGLRNLSLVPHPFSMHLVSRGAFRSTSFMTSLHSIDWLTIESLALDPSKGLPLAPLGVAHAGTLQVTYPSGLAPFPNYLVSGDNRLFPVLSDVTTLTVVNDPFYPSWSASTFERSFPALGTVGGLSLRGTQMTGLDLGATALAVEFLELRDNPVLRTLARPGLALASGNSVTIVGNPALKQCEAVAFTVGRPGSTVSGNNSTPCTCAATAHTGDLLIANQVDATNASCVSSVSGSLTIGADERLDVVSLPALTTIGHDAHLLYTMGDYTKHNNRRVIDFPALTSVGGDLQMEARYSEGTTPAFDLRLNALTSVGGAIDLYASYGSFSGLSGLVSHPGNIYVHGPNLDSNGSGLMVNLAHVGGRVRVEGFYQFRTFFTGLVDIGGNLEVIDVNEWGGGFPLLTSVAGDVVLHPKLLEPFAHLSTVGGSVVWSNNSSFGFFDLALVTTNAHGLVVTGNPPLTSLDPDVHVVGSGPITIQNNPMLPTCIVLDYLNAQTAGGWSGTATVSGNWMGPCP